MAVPSSLAGMEYSHFGEGIEHALSGPTICHATGNVFNPKSRRLPLCAEGARCILWTCRGIKMERPSKSQKVPLVHTKTCMISFVIYLLTPAVAIPFVILQVGPFDKNTASLIATYSNLIYAALFTAYALLLGLRFRGTIKAFSRVKWSLLTFSLLYGQCSFLIFLLVTDKVEGLRLLLFIVTTVFAVLIVAKPTFEFILVYMTVYFWFLLEAVTYVYFRVHFVGVRFDTWTMGFYLSQPSLWAVTCITAGLLLASNHLSPKSRAACIRYCLGVSVLLEVSLFALVYYNVALWTNGDAFSYTQRAITSQWARRVAARYPGLPWGTYEALVNQYADPDKSPSWVAFSDYRLGITTYEDEKGIGPLWGEFYESVLKARGASQYRIVKYDRSGTANDKDVMYELLLYKSEGTNQYARTSEWHNWPGIQIYREGRRKPFARYTIYLPKNMKYNADSPPEPGVLVQIVGKKQPKPEIYGTYLLDIHSLGLYLQYSRNYLDNSVVTLTNITDKRFLDSYLDYLYFSIATISTTGYGDITSIDPTVRILNIVEIVLGWFLLLCFGALLVAGLNKAESK